VVEFFNNPCKVYQAVDQAGEQGANCISWACFSPGGVHSHEEDHLVAMVDLAVRRGASENMSILFSMAEIPARALEPCWRCPSRPISGWARGTATLVGRYFAMDRDNPFGSRRVGLQPDSYW
jgi:bisphosphoglycerate-independent phosphoglycerate mutase (AlkP superfamily)